MHEHRLPDTSTTGRHLPALDGVRGLALLLVLAEHLLWSNPDVGASRWTRLLVSFHAAGWIGVDLFFVLSGFLITGILYDTLPSTHFFRNFYARRALRIFPLYYSFLLLLYLISRGAGAHWFATSTWHTLTYTENLLGGGPVTTASWVNINHFWSLAVEEQFYLVWPLLLFLLRTRRRITLVAVCGALLSFGMRLLLWHSPRVAGNPYLLYSWTPARLDGLLTGAALAMLLRSRRRDLLFRSCRPVLLGGLLATTLFYLRYPGFNFSRFPVISVWLPAILAVTYAALLTEALRAAGIVKTLFSTRILRFFGRYSYGLYVVHLTLVELLSQPLRLFFRGAFHSKGSAVLMAASLVLAASTAAAWLSFRFLEQPCLKLKVYFEDHSSRPKLHRIAAGGNASRTLQP